VGSCGVADTVGLAFQLLKEGQVWRLGLVR
jgi:hypothetical protein